MYWRFCGLVGFIFFLSHHLVLADEMVPHLTASDVRIVPDATGAGLRLPALNLLGVTEQGGRCSGGEEDQQASPTTVTVNALTSHSSPPTLVLPVPVQALLNPWLSKITSQEPAVGSASKVQGFSEHFPWSAEKKVPPPRVDQAWRVAPVGALTQTSGGMTIDGGADLGLEMHAGSTKKDRATNAVKGTASTQVTLAPASDLLPRFGRYLGTGGTNDERATPSQEPLRMVLVTNGAYTLNPSTREITPTGEAVGTLSWMPPMRERFTQDPWHVVAFRWHPTVSCEGRSLLGAEQKTTEATKAQLATLTGNLRGDLRLDFLSPKLVATGDYQYGHRLTDAQTTWEQATVSWKYQLNTHLSLGGSFTHGTRAQQPQKERELKLEMGVTF